MQALPALNDKAIQKVRRSDGKSRGLRRDIYRMERSVSNQRCQRGVDALLARYGPQSLKNRAGDADVHVATV